MTGCCDRWRGVTARASDLSIDGGSADGEEFCDLGDRVLSRFVKTEQVRSLTRVELRLLSFEPAVRASDRHPFPGPHPEEINLKLREPRENVEEHLAHRVVRVINGPTKRQADTAGRQRVSDRPRVKDRPREPIELRHDERVALANGGECLLETRAFAVASCHSVIEIDAIVAHAELMQRLALRGEICRSVEQRA